MRTSKDEKRGESRENKQGGFLFPVALKAGIRLFLT